MSKYRPSEEMLNRIDNDFSYHSPKPDQVERYELLRNAAKALAADIVCNTPPSREQSSALTRLEEAIMHANAAIARHE